MAEAIVRSVYGLKENEISEMTNRQFWGLVNQGMNIMNYKLTGKIELETERDKQARTEREFMERGGLKWLRGELE